MQHDEMRHDERVSDEADPDADPDLLIDFRRVSLRRGGRVLGLCGGYQMLGQSIDDPQGVEGTPGKVPGLS